MSNTITVSIYDAKEYSLMLDSQRLQYQFSQDQDEAVFHVDADEKTVVWLRKLAYEMHVGVMRVKRPLTSEYNNFMKVLDSFNLEISGTKYTWLFGHQYIIKGHEDDLAAFRKHLNSKN